MPLEMLFRASFFSGGLPKFKSKCSSFGNYSNEFYIERNDSSFVKLEQGRFRVRLSKALSLLLMTVIKKNKDMEGKEIEPSVTSFNFFKFSSELREFAMEIEAFSLRMDDEFSF